MARKSALSPKQRRFKAALKVAARDKYGRIIIDSLPKEFRDMQRKLSAKWKRRNKRAHIPAVDPKVYLHKYYPWSYRDYIPTLYLQGFYSEEYAKKRYLKLYGPDALKYVKFIKGKDALEREFAIGKNVYINGKWIAPKGKLMHPKDVLYRKSTKSYNEKVKKAIKLKRDSARNEKALINYNSGLTYNEFANTYIEPEKRVRIQAVRQINEQRKKNLYEE